MEEYCTQVLDVDAPWGLAKHLKIWRADGGEIVATWDTLQAIKDEMLGADVVAIEFFPPAALVVNDVPMRHLWTVDLQTPMHPRHT